MLQKGKDSIFNDKYISDKKRLICVSCKKETDIMYTKGILNSDTFLNFLFMQDYKYIIDEGILCPICGKF